MKSIIERNRFVKVYSYNTFNKKTKNKAYFELQKFVCTKAPSLENFLKEKVKNSTSIYIVYDTNVRMIIGYYTLMPACMIREYEEADKGKVVEREIRVQKNIPCIEIEKFAINEKYLDWLKKNNYNNSKIGYHVFREYIRKIIIFLSEYMNFSFVILHAIRQEKVIQAYKDMGFETFEDDEMNIVSLMDGVTSIKEEYVEDCKFMYLSMENVYTGILEGGI